MIRSRHFFLPITAVIATLIVDVAAAQTTVQLAASRDNTLAENVVNNNNGAGSNLFVGGTSRNGLRRALLAFDLSSIPAGSTITSVTLSLDETRGLARNGAQGFSLHRLLSDWGEGTSAGGGNGAPATAGASTWNANFFGSSTWTNAGGDFDPIASATENFSTSNPSFSSTAGLVADVQDWLDNGSNYGWALLGNESSTDTAWQFASSEAFSGGPLLSVTYIPEPSSICLLGLAGALAGRRRRC